MDEDITVPIRSDLDIVAARQKGRSLAAALSFTPGDATLIATAISELARNIVTYARCGEIRLRVVHASARDGIQVIARDEGPGISDVGVALRAGFSTSGGLGLGLPGVRRLVDEFHIDSKENRGTTVTVRKWTTRAAAPVAWGVATLAQPGQGTCGDLCVVQPFPLGMLVAALDGVGHGEDAATAARIARRLLEDSAAEPVVPLVRQCHQALRGTRGVVLSIASFDLSRAHLTWLGVGNVRGVLLRRVGTPVPGEEALPLRAGVVGVRLPVLREAVVELLAGDTLVFATDGVYGDFARGLARDMPPQLAAESILARHAKATDDALVLVARYQGSRT